MYECLTFRKTFIVRKSISDIINEYLFENGITKTSVANKLGMSQPNFSAQLNKKDLSTDFIWRISEAVDHNFFDELSKLFKKEVKKEPEDLSDALAIMRDLVKQNNLLIEESRAQKTAVTRRP